VTTTLQVKSLGETISPNPSGIRMGVALLAIVVVIAVVVITNGVRAT